MQTQGNYRLRMLILGVTAALACCLLALTLSTPLAQAATATQEKPDASCQGTKNIETGASPSMTTAQTFTAENTGRLTSVEAQVDDRGFAGNLVMEIRTTDTSGVPTTTVLASTSIPASQIPNFQFTNVRGSFDPGAEVVGGQQYSLVLRAPEGGSFVWAGSDANLCSGQSYINPGGGAPFSPYPPTWEMFFSAFITPPAADLSILQADSPDPVGVGEKLTYTLTVTNNGPNAATGVTAVDDLPGTVTYDDAASSPECELTNAQDNVVTCGPVGLTPAGEGSTKGFTIVVTPQDGAVGTVAGNEFITNNATVAGNEFDPDEQNNHSATETTVNPPPDTTAPRVSSVVPQENATGIAPGANVRVSFSEAMSPSSVINAVKLFKAGEDSARKATVTYEEATNMATLDPSADLRREDRYRVVVTTGAKDEAGNRLDQDPSNGDQRKVWRFTVRS